MTTKKLQQAATEAQLRGALVRLCRALDNQTKKYPKSQNVLDSLAWAKQILGPEAFESDPRDQ